MLIFFAPTYNVLTGPRQGRVNMEGEFHLDKNKLVYDLSLICVNQCLQDIQPTSMDEACKNSIDAFEKAYSEISALIEPVVERLNAK